VNSEQFWQLASEGTSDPDRAQINLDRWLNATSNPGTHLSHLAEVPELAKQLMQLLASSQSIADALIQNPELASIITDPAELARYPTFDGIVAEGRQLLAHATSYTHQLDRLRYLKQRWRVPIVVNDLARAWAPEAVWRAISDLADAIITLTAEIVSHEFYAAPVSIIAFGKLGGSELNYSSDVDLVFVLDDGIDEQTEKRAIRFCETLTTALSATMGRGSLYRVDLRLRPFGSAGPIAQTMRSIETYYRSHAELWEMQALLRSRWITGNDKICNRWEDLRNHYCFRKTTSEYTINAFVEMRDRIESIAEIDDLKRGPGGIRDVEFLAQVLQMLHGFAHEELRVRPTLEALRRLEKVGFIEEKDLRELEEGYTFLRQLEHRCQLVNDQQVHMLPRSPDGRRKVAQMLGYEDWLQLSKLLKTQREAIRRIYRQRLENVGGNPNRERVISSLSPAVGAAIGEWFDSLPERDGFYRCLLDNQQSLIRVTRIVEDAPILVRGLSESVSATESIVSGEIEEATENHFSSPDLEEPKRFADVVVPQWRRTVSAWVLQPENELGPMLAELYDEVLRKVRDTVGARFDIVALGSYGAYDTAANSDLDVLLLVDDSDEHAQAEQHAQQLLAFFGELKRFGWPAAIDLRLRPEGRKGLLFHTHSGLKNYELERMEMWERFALGQSRLVAGKPGSLHVALKAAYALPLTPERLKELVAMKHRMEKERVMPQHWKRDVKLGYGGLSDIDWFIHLHEMRYPSALGLLGEARAERGESRSQFAGERDFSSRGRLRRLFQAGLINALEFEALLHARLHLLETRNRLFLLGFSSDVLPENPDKLERLARASRMASGYDFQRKHEQVIHSVRTIYEEGLERLGL